VFEDTVMVWVPPVGPDGLQTVVGETVRIAVTPAWVTVKDRTTGGVTDVVLNSTVPVRGAVEVFAWAVNDTVALFNPVDGLTVTQLGAVTSQLVFEVTALVVVTTPAAGFHAPVGTVKTNPGCDTVIVLLIAGLPTVLVNITVAERATAVGFGAAVNTTVPSPLPEVGATDSQEAPVQVPATCQSVFEDTAIDWVPPVPAGGAQVVAGATVNVAGSPAWVTVNERTTCGLPLVVLNSMVPVRGATEVLAGTVNDTVALFDPVVWLTVTQLGAVTSQLVFDVTALVMVAAPAVGFHAVVGEIVKVGGGGGA